MKRYFFILVICLFVIGCAKYYKVTDPATEKDYYTKKVTRKKSGAIKVKDQRTGKVVTLQSSEIEKITKDQFNFGVLSTDSDPTK